MLILNITVKAQTAINSRISIKLDTISVDKYIHTEETIPEFKTLYLKTPYGKFELEDVKLAEQLKNAVIKSVDLVYTKYPIDEDFSILNRRRIEYLHLVCPSIFNNTMTEWRIISQTHCKSEYAASNMFHGFVITYKAAPTAESAKRELAYLKDILANKVAVKDSTVLKIFERNKWKDMTVVTDYTGSMSPYIGQVFLWYRLTFATKDFSEFVFFNDGDAKEDDTKRTGKTGGIYYCKSNIKDTVLETAFRCSRNGYGGDVQENNIEAALFAIKKNPDLKEIIMIVDNWAPMRDYMLISQIKIPVHVVVCGLSSGVAINTEYLDLARHTKGSIHTIEEDITDLSKLVEGKKISMDNFDYAVQGGRFVKIKKAL